MDIENWQCFTIGPWHECNNILVFCEWIIFALHDGVRIYCGGCSQPISWELCREFEQVTIEAGNMGRWVKICPNFERMMSFKVAVFLGLCYISIFISGDVVLENLVLKQNALEELNIPVQTVYGHLGKCIWEIFMH